MVKFVSVFPYFKLDEGKISLKDRAKFITQFFQHLFAGLKNDESVIYHNNLVSSYFESLSFFIWKRFQPLVERKEFNFEDEDIKFMIA